MNIRQLLVVGLLSFGIVSIEAGYNRRQLLSPREQQALLRKLTKEEGNGRLSPQSSRRLAFLRSAMSKGQVPVAAQQHNYDELPPQD